MTHKPFAITATLGVALILSAGRGGAGRGGAGRGGNNARSKYQSLRRIEMTYTIPALQRMILLCQ